MDVSDRMYAKSTPLKRVDSAYIAGLHFWLLIHGTLITRDSLKRQGRRATFSLAQTMPQRADGVLSSSPPANLVDCNPGCNPCERHLCFDGVTGRCRCRGPTASGHKTTATRPTEDHSMTHHLDS